MATLFTYTKNNPPLFCLHCGEPIPQSRRGRTRLYCEKPKCRKAGNRANIKSQHDQAVRSLERNMRLRWEELDSPTTRFTLEQIFKQFGISAAIQATEAVFQELEARVRNPIDQARFAYAVRQKMEIEERS